MTADRRHIAAHGRDPVSRPLPRPRRNVPPLAVVAFVCDAFVIGVAGLVASLVRTQIDVLNRAFDAASSLAVAGPLILIGWLLVLVLMGAYRASAFGAGSDEYRLVAAATLATAGLTGIGCYLARFQLARGFFVFLFLIGLPLLVLERYALRKALHAARRRGRFRQRVLIVGDQAHVDDVAHVLRREMWLGYDVVGALTPAAEPGAQTPAGIPVLGNTDDVVGLSSGDIEVVFLASGGVASAAQMRRMVWDLEPWGVQVLVAPSVTDVARERVRIRPVGGLPLLHIDPPTAARASRWGKRAFDLVGATCLLVLLSPVLVVAALRIKLHDRGPVLFRQTRVSRGGQEFDCLKLRSMVVGAEDILGELPPGSAEIGPLFKLKDDPRITRPGRWLRRYSIDELPQLVNVLRGEMSLVGPRPPLPTEVAAYPSDMHGRLRVRPGMTGLWQVSGRADLSWTEAVRLDLYYVDNWSMLQDLWILGRTVGAVLRSRGAY